MIHLGSSALASQVDIILMSQSSMVSPFMLEDQEGHKTDRVKYVNGKLKGLRIKMLTDVKREICER